MKRLIPLLALLVAFTGCSGAATSIPTPEPVAFEQAREADLPAPAPFSLYRGQVEAVTGTTIEVAQLLPGYNYGHERIQFTLTEETLLPAEGTALQGGTYVEVEWDGRLTPGDPPAGTAARIEVISDVSDSVVLNGRIVTAARVDDGYRILLEPFTRREERATYEEIERILENRDPEEKQSTIMLTVPALALDGGLTAEGLVEGAELCAITKGVAALTSPVQYPVHALLPYSRSE